MFRKAITSLVALLLFGLLALFFPPHADAKDSHDISRSSPPQPPHPPTNPDTDAVDDQDWMRHVKRNRAYNEFIPPANTRNIRVMTFNVHLLTDTRERDSLKQILDDIDELDPTVAVLQEVPLWNRRTFERGLERLGYNWKMCTTSEKLANVLISRLPIEHSEAFEFDAAANTVTRCAVMASIVAPNGRSFAFIGTQLETVSQVARLAQMAELVRYIRRSIEPRHEYFAVGGDFNAQWDDEVMMLIRKENMFEVFSALHWQSPRYTSKSGGTIDFIFVDDNWAVGLVGAYVLQTTSSVHLPVLADLKLPGA